MRRRHFLKSSSIALVALGLVPVEACRRALDESNANFPLAEATIDDLLQMMAMGKETARSIAEQYLQRIDAIDKQGPKLNAIIEINPDVLTLADELDSERKAGKMRGPLHGIPVLLKDNINTGDKMMTTAGSVALEGHRAAQDAFFVERLRKSGALILGKTNLSEWANFRSTRSSSGWSSRGGQTRNPYVLDRSPCGSSAGSGTAVAANLCAVAIGTETDGSIACPCSVNGIVGIKPTVGLVSRSGVIPISATQDTAGPMARTVRDAAIVLGCMTGMDKEDLATAQSEGKITEDFTRFLDADALEGKRIGVEKSFLHSHEEVDALLSEALDAMRSRGATIVEVEMMAVMGDVWGNEFDVLKYQFKDGINKYLAREGIGAKTLEDLIVFDSLHADKVMPHFRQEIFKSAQALGDLNTPAYLEALEKIQTTARNAIDGIMKENSLNAICGPSNGPSWCIDEVNGDSFTGYGTYSPAAVAGYPHVTVPMGMVQDLPIGMSFLSTAWDEGQLLAIAYAFEQATQKRVRPPLEETLPL